LSRAGRESPPPRGQAAWSRGGHLGLAALPRTGDHAERPPRRSAVFHAVPLMACPPRRHRRLGGNGQRSPAGPRCSRQAEPGRSSRPLPSGCTHAVDPPRFEHALEPDTCLQARRPHVLLGTVEEAEDGLVGRDEDRAKEVQLTTVSSELTGRRAGARSGLGEFLLGHAWPVALDQVQAPLCAAGHGDHATGARTQMNRVLPYIYAAPPCLCQPRRARPGRRAPGCGYTLGRTRPQVRARGLDNTRPFRTRARGLGTRLATGVPAAGISGRFPEFAGGCGPRQRGGCRARRGSGCQACGRRGRGSPPPFSGS